MTGPLLLGVGTFLLMLPWGSWVVRALLERGISKQIRTDGPASHQVKSGTATMGGLYILAGVTVITVVLVLRGFSETLGPLLALLAYGALGAYDDLRGLRDSEGVGWLARSKFSWQWGLALVLALLLFSMREEHAVVLPVSGAVFDMGWWFVPVVGLLLVATSNAVNLTDGLDGLAGGTLAIAYAAYGIIAALSGQLGLSLFCFVVVGALGAFLWFNVHPALLFMGDTGSQGLGAGLAAVAVLTGHWLLLPVIGLIFVAESLSDILQVGYFKFSRRRYGEGRRILRMAPLHHHFELGGWSEVQVTLRFWIVAALAAVVGLVLGMGLP